MKFKWTKEKPDQEGWYWVKSPNLTPRIVKTICGPDAYTHIYKYSPTVDKNFEYSGPIPLPSYGNDIDLEDVVSAVTEINEVINESTLIKWGEEESWLTVTTDGYIIIVGFKQEYRVWSTDEDERIYNEDTDEYEPIKDCLVRLLRDEIEKISKIGLIFK